MDHLRRQGLTKEEWLDQLKELPEGFREWKHTYSHWDQSNPIHWAIYCYKQEIKRRNKRNKVRNRNYYLILEEDLQVNYLLKHPVKYHVGVKLGVVNVINVEEGSLSVRYHLHLKGNNDMEVINKAKELCKQYKDGVK